MISDTTTRRTANFSRSGEPAIGSDEYMEQMGAKKLSDVEFARIAHHFPAELPFWKKALRFLGFKV